MPDAAGTWNAYHKGQDDLDIVIMQAKEKAEAYAVGDSNSTQNTPKRDNKVNRLAPYIGSGSGSGGSRNHSRSAQSRRTNERFAFNRGKCSANNCPFEHVKSQARSQSNCSPPFIVRASDPPILECAE